MWLTRGGKEATGVPEGHMRFEPCWSKGTGGLRLRAGARAQSGQCRHPGGIKRLRLKGKARPEPVGLSHWSTARVTYRLRLRRPKPVQGSDWQISGICEAWAWPQIALKATGALGHRWGQKGPT